MSSFVVCFFKGKVDSHILTLKRADGAEDSFLSKLPLWMQVVCCCSPLPERPVHFLLWLLLLITLDWAVTLCFRFSVCPTIAKLTEKKFVVFFFFSCRSSNTLMNTCFILRFAAERFADQRLQPRPQLFIRFGQ